MEKNNKTETKWIGNTWDRLPVVIRAIFTGLAVSTLGIAAWMLLATSRLPMPWQFILMLAILWAYLKFFSGQWGPNKSKENRAQLFRRNKLPRQIWILSLLAGLLIVLIQQSGMVFSFRISEFPASIFLEEYDFVSALPAWSGWLVVIMISLVAAVCEETGFRGYMQVPLEKPYSPILSIGIVSIVFVLVHLHQAWAGSILIGIFLISVMFGSLAYYSGSIIPGILGHFIMDVCNFSFWWTDLGGQFSRKPLDQTGIDSHFIIWLMVFVLSAILFIFLLRKISHLRKVHNLDSL